MVTADAKRSVGVREVAAAAGVSRQTVSRVMNHHPSIRPETRDRVLAVIDELGYRPNRAALMLGTRSSRTLGVLVASSNATSYGPAAALQGIEAAAREQGYAVHTTMLVSTLPADIEEALQLQVDAMVDGLVVIAPQPRVMAVFEKLQLDLPYVFLQGRTGHDPRELFVDQYAGARAITRHLLVLGHRDIVHIAGPQEWIEADARMRGYLDELSDWDVTPLPPVLGDWTSDFGYRAGLQVAEDPEVTAVFCSNDVTALGMIHGLREMGRRVPEDVSVAGFDDIPEARHFWPPLTTAQQDFAELGRRCVERLVSEEQPADPVRITPTLIVRRSTAAPRR